MKRHLVLCASIGFLVGSCWVLVSFLMPPELLVRTMREPMVQGLFVVSCPVLYFMRHIAIQFWWVPLINAGTYGMVCLMVEAVRGALRTRGSVAHGSTVMG